MIPPPPLKERLILEGNALLFPKEVLVFQNVLLELKHESKYSGEMSNEK